jgi:hypothetical protein
MAAAAVRFVAWLLGVRRERFPRRRVGRGHQAVHTFVVPQVHATVRASVARPTRAGAVAGFGPPWTSLPPIEFVADRTYQGAGVPTTTASYHCKDGSVVGGRRAPALLGRRGRPFDGRGNDNGIAERRGGVALPRRPLVGRCRSWPVTRAAWAPLLGPGWRDSSPCPLTSAQCRPRR